MMEINTIIIYALFYICVLFLYCIILKIQNVRLKHYINNRIKITKFKKVAADIMLEYYEENLPSKLKDYKLINAYLLQSECVLLGNYDAINKIEIIPLSKQAQRSYNEDKVIDDYDGFKPLINEYQLINEELACVPDNAEKLFWRLNCELGNIYQIQHPYKYFYFNQKARLIELIEKIKCKHLKKNNSMQNLSKYIATLEKMDHLRNKLLSFNMLCELDFIDEKQFDDNGLKYSIDMI